MAKAITLNDTRLTEIVFTRNGAAMVRLTGDVIDDTGTTIKKESVVVPFADLPAGVKTNLNAAFKPMSRQFNILFADEDSETWTDLSV